METSGTDLFQSFPHTFLYILSKITVIISSLFVKISILLSTRYFSRSALATPVVGQFVPFLKLFQSNCLSLTTQNRVNQIGFIFLMPSFFIRIVPIAPSPRLTGIGFVAE